MDETHLRTFRPWPGVRWGAVATGALLGAALWLVLLRFDAPRALVDDVEPGLGRRLWWVAAPLLAAGVASWAGASASAERGIRGAYLHGLLAWAGALLLAAMVGSGSVGVLPQPGWSGLASVVGAVVGSALGRALIAGRVAAPWMSGTGRRFKKRGEPALQSRPAPWREVRGARRGPEEERRPGTHEGAKDLEHDLH
ncbi:MAG TPA: hypothetical protein VF794_31925 [Archangium sp.]|jgi:hypothetical protein|uniref:hypothetical protein n=1 Tax=Archangium sp. TaxID=1872627 RepID=UPI002ED95E1D